MTNPRWEVAACNRRKKRPAGRLDGRAPPSGGGHQGNGKRIGCRPVGFEHGRGGIGRHGNGAHVAHAGGASAGKIFAGRGGAATAAGGNSQLELQIAQRISARIHAGADLAFGNGIAYANVHANDYRQKLKRKQASQPASRKIFFSLAPRTQLLEKSDESPPVRLDPLPPRVQRAAAWALRTAAGAMRKASRYLATVRRAMTMP